MIETSRLVIRKFRIEDTEDVSQYLLNPHTMHYIPETFTSLQAIQTFFQEKHDAYFVVECKNTQTVIGHIYFEAFLGIIPMKLDGFLTKHTRVSRMHLKQLLLYVIMHLKKKVFIVLLQPVNPKTKRHGS